MYVHVCAGVCIRSFNFKKYLQRCTPINRLVLRVDVGNNSIVMFFITQKTETANKIKYCIFTQRQKLSTALTEF